MKKFLAVLAAVSLIGVSALAEAESARAVTAPALNVDSYEADEIYGDAFSTIYAKFDNASTKWTDNYELWVNESSYAIAEKKREDGEYILEEGDEISIDEEFEAACSKSNVKYNDSDVYTTIFANISLKRYDNDLEDYITYKNNMNVEVLYSVPSDYEYAEDKIELYVINSSGRLDKVDYSLVTVDDEIYMRFSRNRNATYALVARTVDIERAQEAAEEAENGEDDTNTPTPTRRPQNTPTPTPTRRPQNTPTPVPTRRPQSTSTPVPTRRPQNTPAPTKATVTKTPAANGNNGDKDYSPKTGDTERSFSSQTVIAVSALVLVGGVWVYKKSK